MLVTTAPSVRIVRPNVPAGVDAALRRALAQLPGDRFPGAGEFAAALETGRAKGQLTQAELIEALHAVELTPEVLTALIDRVTAEGVALVADEEEDLGVDVTPPKATRAVPKSSGALRADEPRPSLPREVALASAPEPLDGGFGVPSPGASAE